VGEGEGRAPTGPTKIVKCHLQRLHKKTKVKPSTIKHTKAADQIKKKILTTTTTTATSTITINTTMLNNYYLMAFALPRLSEPKVKKHLSRMHMNWPKGCRYS